MKVRTKPEIHDHVLDEYDHQGLKPDAIYPVIEIDDECFRILDENNDPILYPKYLFLVVDSTIPNSWVKRDYPDNEYHINPPEMSERTFWDRYHNGDPEAIAQFRMYLHRVNEIGE